ncbi:MAG TPA: MFS transporter [Candidatus Limnocylindrales bacterium]|nr:MFS transporter [Candidatus Limnocylindrales bacterium]
MPVTLALTIAVFAVGVDSYIVAAVLPAIADELREPVAAVGLLASAYNLPTAIFAPIFGPFSDRRGRRAAMLLGLTIFAIAAAACVVAPTLPLLILARAINGLGAAIVLPATFAYAADLPSPAERARAMGIAVSAFPLSNLIGLPIGALVAGLAGWHAAFGFVFVVAVAAFFLIRRLPEERPAAGTVHRGYLESYGAVLGNRRALAVLSVTFFWFAGSMGLFIYLGEFFHESFGLSTTQAGLAYLVVGVVGVAASRLSARLLGRIGPRRTVLLGIAAFVVGSFVLPFTVVAIWVALLVLAFWAFGTWFGQPGQQMIVAGLSDRLRGTMLAFNSSALNLGGVFGPIATGQVLAWGGFNAAARWGTFVGLIALAIAWFVLPRRPAPPVPVAAELAVAAVGVPAAPVAHTPDDQRPDPVPPA